MHLYSPKVTKKLMNTILVTGATGHFGKAAIDALLKKGIDAKSIYALVRDEAKAADLKSKGINIKTGTYDDYKSLVSAFKGIDKLLFVSGSEVEKRVPQHENVVKAAKEAGVKHVVYTSFVSNNETSTSAIYMVADSHLKTEAWLKESGLAYTFMKNSLYLDFIPVFIGDKIFETGMIYYPGGEGKGAYVLRNEMAEIAANILTSDGHEGKSYKITGNKTYSYNDVAKIISKASGKTVNYIAPGPEEFVKTMKGFGLPDGLVTVVTAFATATANGEFEIVDTAAEKLLGRTPTSVEAFLTEYYSK